MERRTHQCKIIESAAEDPIQGIRPQVYERTSDR